MAPALCVRCAVTPTCRSPSPRIVEDRLARLAMLGCCLTHDSSDVHGQKRFEIKPWLLGMLNEAKEDLEVAVRRGNFAEARTFQQQVR